MRSKSESQHHKIHANRSESDAAGNENCDDIRLTRDNPGKQ